MMIKPVMIGNRPVGPGQPCFIVAEAGVNHNGDINLAHRLIDAAADAGADAVKFQSFVTEETQTKHAEKAPYQKETTGTEGTQFDIIKKLELSPEDFKNLFNYTLKKGIIFLSTPYDKQNVDLLVQLGVPAIKISSADITYFPLIRHAATKKKPLILATGMATLGEVESAMEAVRRTGCDEIVLLHCVTNYPIRDDEANLRVMDTLMQAFHVPVGFSDHTTGIAVPVAAVARGACVIEKHLTLDRELPGPDHISSLTPTAFKVMVNDIRIVEGALGSPVKTLLPVELENRRFMRRSIVASIDLPAGTILSHEHLAFKRPGDGLDVSLIDFLLGRQLIRFIPKDTKLSLDDVRKTDSK